MSLASFDESTLPPMHSGRILKHEQATMAADAVALLQRAREEAEALKQAAREIYESEKARGYAEGLEAGQAQAARHHLDTISATLDYLQTSRDAMVETVIACLSKILASLPPEELTLNLAAKALEGLREQSRIIFHVNAEDLDYFTSRLSVLRGDREKNWLQVTVSRTVKRGNCVLESQIGLVDASIETQLAVIHDALKRAL